MSRRLTADEVQTQLAGLPGWQGDPAILRRSVEFPDFPTAISAIGEIAEIAEQMGHHPDMDVRWRTITFMLTTHDAGGVTQLDVELAHRISAIAASLVS